MLTRKVCPKCHGNLYKSNDYYGTYEQCLQCGYTLDLDIVDDGRRLEDPSKENSVTVEV